MAFQTDFKLAGPLAGLFGGIEQAQNQERQGLANAYQTLKNQEQEYTSAEAQAKLQDPQYIQMKLQNDMSKMGKEIPLNQLEAEYNVANRALAHLKAAAATDPAKLQQVAGMYMQQLKIDPNSQEGQMIMQDPVGFAEKTVQMLAASATKNPEYMRQYGLQEQKDTAAMDRENVKGKFDLQKANISASAQRDAASRYERGDLIKYSGQLTGEIQNYNTNIAKLEGKEMDAAIVADFVKRNGKEPTPDQITESKQSFKKQLEQERDALIEQRDSVRGMVGGKLGMKPQGTGTAGNPIKLD